MNKIGKILTGAQEILRMAPDSIYGRYFKVDPKDFDKILKRFGDHIYFDNIRYYKDNDVLIVTLFKNIFFFSKEKRKLLSKLGDYEEIFYKTTFNFIDLATILLQGEKLQSYLGLFNDTSKDLIMDLEGGSHGLEGFFTIEEGIATDILKGFGMQKRDGKNLIEIIRGNDAYIKFDKIEYFLIGHHYRDIIPIIKLGRAYFRADYLDLARIMDFPLTMKIYFRNGLTGGYILKISGILRDIFIAEMMVNEKDHLVKFSEESLEEFYKKRMVF